MSAISGGELFVKAMATEGVKFLFGLPSPTADPILANLEDNGVRFVPVHHESAAVHMAEGNWTMEEPNETALYGRTFGTEPGVIRWDTIAEGLGCHGEYVESAEGIEPALRRAQESDLPAVVAIHTNADANRAIPPEMVGRFFEVYSGPLA